MMKKFINNPDDLTSELLEGFCNAFPKQVKLVADKIVCRATPKSEDKVAIITLGGSGHEPALSGFVGEGMLDASVVGDIFAAPGPPKVIEALELFKRDAGILFVVLNHAGDVMSGNMAMQMAEKKGIKVKMLLTHEDIAPGANAPVEDRRGLVGCIPLYKVAGAAAEAGKSLDEVYDIAAKYNEQMATLAVAAKPATHPSNGEQIFEIGDDEMEIGMGQHGEAGTGRSAMLSADETAKLMVTQLALAVGASEGDKTLLMVNGAGATTLMEQFIVHRGATKVLAEKGISVANSWVGEFLTVQEMAGFQMHLGKLDDELLAALEAPCSTPFYTVK